MNGSAVHHAGEEPIRGEDMTKALRLKTTKLWRRWLALACVMTFCLAGATLNLLAAQEPPDPAAVSQRFSEWNAALEQIARELNGGKLDETQLEGLSDRAIELRSQVVDFSEEIEVFTNDARELRESFMADKPSEGAESDQTKAQADELTKRVALFDGWTRQSNLTLARADQLLDRISSQRLAQLAKSLAERGPLPINPIVWWRAVGEIGALGNAATAALGETYESWREPGSETGITAASVLGIAITAWLTTLLALRFMARMSWPILRPTLSGPACQITLAALVPALPWIAAAVAASQAASLKDWLPLVPGRGVVMALLTLLATAAVNLWILRAAIVRPPAGAALLTQDDPDRTTAIRLYAILLALFSIDIGLHTLPSTMIGANLLAVWALIIALAGSYFGREAVTVASRLLARHGVANGKLARLLLLLVPMVVAAASILAAAFGYGQFGIYVISNSLATAAVCIVAWALRQAAQEIVVRACDIASPSGQFLANKLGFDQPTLRLAQFWLGMGLDVAVVLATAIALMVVWGTGTQDAMLMIERLIEGVRVGNVTLSLADLVIAILTFMIGVWITRFVQGILEHRVFPGTQLDLGVRNSLRSGLGYIGVIIAGAFAILVLGIDLSNLALVAGALSVGIGFGLQNIINNFVSGLILLIERPVKVGDWISVGGNEGVIKRINVRSTELITDARASVLVPNADFLGVSVTNWTHKDLGGRLHLTFSLPEDLGAEGGRDLLIACAKAHPKVLSDPPIKVLLLDIGGGYSFELAADVADVTTMKEVSSDLRYAVDKALRGRKD